MYGRLEGIHIGKYGIPYRLFVSELIQELGQVVKYGVGGQTRYVVEFGDGACGRIVSRGRASVVLRIYFRRV